MENTVVITGGCGYVGSHIAASIKRNTSYRTIVIDKKAKQQQYTHRWADQVFDTDYSNPDILALIARIKPVAIIHCAASSLVGPSVWDPGNYYDNNVNKFKILLDMMAANDIKKIIFSSSSSVYGDGNDTSKESDKCTPISPYGKTKLIGEMLLQDYGYAYGIDSVAFRYFNAVGADPDGALGQAPGASHLIARIMESIIKKETFTIYGDDYDTADGTCVRDYVHVSDIADAHVSAIDLVKARKGSHIYNLGSGVGYSVKEIITAVETVTGHTLDSVVAQRRYGDPSWRIADASKAKTDLKWQPKRDLNQIVSDAWRWYNSNTYKKLY